MSDDDALEDDDRLTMVAPRHRFSAGTDWGGRAESAEAIAGRWLTLLGRLRSIDPAFARWVSLAEDDSIVPVVPTLEAQIAAVTAGTDRHVSGRMAWSGGSRLRYHTRLDNSPRKFDLSGNAGNDGPFAYTNRNYVSITTNDFSIPEPHLVGFPIFRQLLLALAETFEVTQAYAWSGDLLDLLTREQARRRDLPLAWISYVAPRFAMLVTPPPDAIVEHRPDGGLLMAATAETFAMANPAHLAAAQAIQASLKAYNAVPWTPEFGK